jgi:hypothetical protein
MSIPSFAPALVPTLILLATLAIPVGVEAQRREGHGPPPEALDACEGLRAGASCSVTTPHGTLSGTCVAPEGRALACMPAHPPDDHGEHRGPPPEALDACEGIEVGDACVVDGPRGVVEGRCTDGPAGNACVPAGRRPRDA